MSMKTLYLLRHGHAESKEVQPDDARNLDINGQKAALLTGEKLLKEGLRPDKILSSHANRAHQTAQIVAETLGYPVKNIEIEHDIYYTDDKTVLDIIKQQNDKYSSVMIAGHNPTLSRLAINLSKNEDHDLSPAGVLVLQSDATTWSDVLNHPLKEILYFEPEV
ncbi:MAG: phosphohistidine phosphatase SixA [Bacteroidia bacterium]